VTLRSRLTLTLLLSALVPLAAFALLLRREIAAAVRSEQQAGSVGDSIHVARQLSAIATDVSRRLRGPADALRSEPRLGLALSASDSSSVAWLTDWAGQAMRLAGLDALMLQDSAGAVLSSGHFRNSYGQTLALPVAPTPMAGAAWMARVRVPSGSMTVIAALDTVRAGNRALTLLAGLAPDSGLLASLPPRPEVEVRLVESVSANDSSTGSKVVEVPLADLSGSASVPGSAALELGSGTQPLGGLSQAFTRGWQLAAILAVSLALAMAAWFASRVSRPVRELAARVATADLDQLDGGSASDRSDEVGALARTIDGLATRLRARADELRDAERRAVTGELARQVNHDIKNGLTPIRNVLRHLEEVATSEPGSLAHVYNERKSTLESSISHLDALARTYAQLTPAITRGATDVNALLEELVSNATDARVQADTSREKLLVRTDAVTLRRIVENLMMNAIESLPLDGGTVLLSAESMENSKVRIRVKDTGRGMTPAEVNRAFDEFHTTKPGGTGLGLSVVRSLVLDLGGAIRVASERGRGSIFEIDLPREKPEGDAK
jgi:signal transduction histidine kinase